MPKRSTWDDIADEQVAPATGTGPQRTAWDDLADGPPDTAEQPTDTTTAAGGVQKRSITTAGAPLEDDVPAPDTTDPGVRAIDSAVEAVTPSDQNLKERIVKPGLAALQGVTYDWGDEAVAAMESAGDVGLLGLLPDKKPERDAAYRQRLGEWRPIFDQSKKDNTAAYLGGAVLSPSPAGKLNLAGKLAVGGFQGALAGLGASKADITQGDPSQLAQAAKDTATGGAFGVAGAGAAQGLSNVASRFTSPIQAAIARLKLSKLGDIARMVDKEVASLRGTANSFKADANRATENLQRFQAGIQPPGASLIDTPAQVAVDKALANPKVKDMLNSIAENTAEDSPQKLARFLAAKAEAEAAASNAPQETAKRFADYFNQSALKKEVMPRLGLLGQRAAVAAGLGVGGGVVGGAVGGAAGAAGQLMGLPVNPVDSAKAGAILGAGRATLMASGQGVTSMMIGKKGLFSSPLAQTAAMQTGANAVNATSRGAQAAALGASRAQPAEPDEEDRKAVDAFLNAP